MASMNCSLQLFVPTTRARFVFLMSLSTVFCGCRAENEGLEAQPSSARACGRVFMGRARQILSSSKPKCKLLQFPSLLLKKSFGSLLMDGSLNHLRATVRLACCTVVLQKNGKGNAVGSFQLLARLVHSQQLGCTSNICIWGYLHWECWAWGSLKAACKQDQRVELTVRAGWCFKATCSIWDPSSCSVCDSRHCLTLLQFHQPVPPSAVQTQKEQGGRAGVQGVNSTLNS